MSRKVKRYKARFAGLSKKPAVDWALLASAFPTHREHIFRVRNNPVKLSLLSQRLIKARVKKLRTLAS